MEVSVFLVALFCFLSTASTNKYLISMLLTRIGLTLSSPLVGVQQIFVS